MKRLSILSLFLLTLIGSIAAQNISPFFPKMKPVQKSVFVSVASNETPEAIHACRIFQGILNRDSAEVFLTTGDKEMDWWKYLDLPWKRPDNGVIVQGDNRGLRTLFKTYKDRLDKLVVCNFANNDYTFNMALLMACAGNALPVSEKLKNELVAEFGWNKEIVDIRNKWTSIQEAYDWALEEIMPQLNKQLVFSIGLRDDWKNGGWRIYDYAVATRSFAFWVNDETSTGKSIIKKILNTPGYPKNSVVMGYGMHGDDLNLTTNPEGFGFVVSDLFPNASYYSSFPTQTFETSQREGIALKTESNKIYVALHWSDGDNIQFNHNGALALFNQKERGKVPVSMTLSPTLMEIAPFILKYYNEQATENDEFIGGPSGVQYIQEPYYKPSDFESWCKMNGQWLAAAGMHTTASSLRWPAQPFYNNNFVKTGVTGTLAWSGYRDAYNWCGMPVVCTGGVCANEANLYDYLKGVSTSPHYPVFTGVYLVQAGMSGPGYAAINRVVERLNNEFPDRFVFQRASDLMATAKSYFEEAQKPYKELTVPGIIEAEDFDLGGQGAGYYDMAKSNEGGKYRTEENSYVGIGEGGTGHHVGWTATGEWLNYTIHVTEESSYQMTIRYSTPANQNKGICVMLDDEVLSTVELKATAGANSYEDHTVRVNLPTGKHNLRVQVTTGGINLDYFRFVADNDNVPIIYTDKVYKITALNSGKALSIKTNNSINGTKIVQRAYAGTTDQLWRIEVAGDACYTITSVASGLSITLRGTGTIAQFPFECITNNGKWNLYYQGNGVYHIGGKGTIRNLEIVNNSLEDESELSIADASTGTNQLFSIEEETNFSHIDQPSDNNIKGIAYPNPFSHSITIPLTLNEEQNLIFSVFDLVGNTIYQKSINRPAGSTEIIWNAASGIAPGTYIYRLIGKSFNSTDKIVKE